MRPPQHLQRKPWRCTVDFLLLAYQVTHFMCDTLAEKCDLQLLKTPPTGDLFSRNHLRNVSGITKYLRSFFFNFIFYLSGMAWDIEGDSKLYNSRLQCWYESARCLIQKMINSNSQDAIYKPEWGAESTTARTNTGLTDELSWLGSSYPALGSNLYPAESEHELHTHTHTPFCNPLFINTLSSLCKGWEGSSLKLRQNHISTLMSLKLVKAFPWSSDCSLLSQ